MLVVEHPLDLFLSVFKLNPHTESVQQLYVTLQKQIVGITILKNLHCCSLVDFDGKTKETFHGLCLCLAMPMSDRTPFIVQRLLPKQATVEHSPIGRFKFKCSWCEAWPQIMQRDIILRNYPVLQMVHQVQREHKLPIL